MTNQIARNAHDFKVNIIKIKMLNGVTFYTRLKRYFKTLQKHINGHTRGDYSFSYLYVSRKDILMLQ